MKVLLVSQVLLVLDVKRSCLLVVVVQYILDLLLVNADGYLVVFHELLDLPVLGLERLLQL